MSYPRLLKRFELARTVVVSTFPRAAAVALGIDSVAGTRGRQFGLFDGHNAIVLAPRLERQPVDRIDGVIRHEWGHAIDALYDARTVVRRLGGGRLPATPERRADDIAKRLWGAFIYYDDDDVQTTDPIGRPYRPAYLPQ